MSDRESIMELIRNEYDPKPKLDAADYPGFEWDDGAGRIADAILADQTLLARKHADNQEMLVKALQDIAAWPESNSRITATGMREIACQALGKVQS